jgi:hypothetical protein
MGPQTVYMTASQPTAAAAAAAAAAVYLSAGQHQSSAFAPRLDLASERVVVYHLQKIHTLCISSSFSQLIYLFILVLKIALSLLQHITVAREPGRY